MQSFDELVCDGRRLGGIGPGKQQAELVATQPRQKVSPARPLLEQASDALQEIVPGLVPEAVVDILEVVQIDQQQRTRGPVAGHPLHVQP